MTVGVSSAVAVVSQAVMALRAASVRTENAAYATRLSGLGLERGTAEELDFDAVARGLCCDRGDAGGRADKGDLVPRFGSRNSGDQFDLEFVWPGARSDE